LEFGCQLQSFSNLFLVSLKIHQRYYEKVNEIMTVATNYLVYFSNFGLLLVG